MESVRDPAMGPADRRQVWEAPSQYPFQIRTFNRSKSGPLITPNFPQPGGIKEILPVVGKPISPLVGWDLTTVLVESRWFTGVHDVQKGG